jgi:MFS family permease
LHEDQLGGTNSPTTKPSLKNLPRNVWAVSLTSFFMDVSSEMVLNVLPLFSANVLGVRTGVIGLIEGVAEATASILKVFSGWLSDRLRARKWLAVAGYAVSAFSKPFFYWASSWQAGWSTRSFTQVLRWPAQRSTSGSSAACIEDITGWLSVP